MHEISPLWFIPFGALLLAIAVMPFIHREWWEHHYPKVSIGLGLLTLGYYLFWVKNYERAGGTLHEYVGFIALVGSLYVVSGGVLVRLKGEATPEQNVMLLAIGSVLANLVGTAGASMLLIRPFIRMNRYRITAYHIVFFIFIVSNVAGSLTPIGDPPLFLGYLKGIPFFWTAEHLWKVWLFGVLWLLALFYFFDRINFRRAPREIREVETPVREWRFDGLYNLGFLAVILGAVFIQKPVYLREAIMAAAAAGAYFCTRRKNREIHEANEFNFIPLKEVAILFIGIFCTMMPVLDWLEHNAGRLGVSNVAAFYWAPGILSSVLDNAPTYLNFLSACVGLFVDPQNVEFIQKWVESGMTGSLAGQHQDVLNTIDALRRHHPELLAAGAVPVSDIQVCYLIGNAQYNAYIVAISAGAVFFGAMTYIGNAPNFMVKSIAEHRKVEVPSFFGYLLKYAVPLLLPMLTAVWFFFFRS